jgi:hypothetical protein
MVAGGGACGIDGDLARQSRMGSSRPGENAPPNRAAEDFLPFTHPLSWTDPGQADRDEVSNLFSRPDSCNVWAPRNKMCA